MIAAGVIGGVFLVCTLVMFVGVKERDGERILSCVCVWLLFSKEVLKLPTSLNRFDSAHVSHHSPH